MIALAKELQEAFEKYNWWSCDDDKIDWYELMDTINDPTDEKEIKQVINDLKAATK
jgi:hypothetical protein